MLRTLIALSTFAVTFSVGIFLGDKPRQSSTVQHHEGISLEPIHSANVPSAESSVSETSQIEFRDVPTFEDFAGPDMYGNLIDLSEPDGIFWESEVIAKTGEKWLLLAGTPGNYALVSSRATVTKKHSVSRPGDEKDVELSFADVRHPTIAVRRIKGLKPGPIKTIYQRPSREEIEQRNLPIDPMKTSYKRDFNVDDRWYSLRVSRGTTVDGTVVGLLVLESEGVEQVIAQNFHELGFGERIGELLWVGDLDRDGKLDFYFDHFNEKGYFLSRLYLSSAAGPGNLVKQVAEFSSGGC